MPAKPIIQKRIPNTPIRRFPNEYNKRPKLCNVLMFMCEANDVFLFFRFFKMYKTAKKDSKTIEA